MNILKRAIRAGLLVIGLPLVLAAGLCGAAAEGVRRCSGS